MKHKLLSIILGIMFFISGNKSASALEVDDRALRMRSIFVKYNSPMIGLEEKLIKIAEDYNLDWTILAAIAGTESSFAKRMPHNCINPYGWGIYGTNKLCFNSLEDAAVAVATGLSKKYNTSSIESIGRTYNKVSTLHWINHTTFFSQKIKTAQLKVSELPHTL